MNKTSWLITTLTLALVVAASAYADPAGGSAPLAPALQITVSVDGESQTVPAQLVGDSVSLENAPVTLSFSGGDTVTLQDVTGQLNVSLSVMVHASDSGAPSAFVIVLVFPLSPGLPGTTFAAFDLRGTLTDGGSDGVSISPFMIPRVAQYAVNSFADVLGDLGPAFGPVGGTATYGPFSARRAFDCSATATGSCAEIDEAIAFTGSGGDDAYFLATHYTLTDQVPSTAPAMRQDVMAFAAGALVLSGFWLLRRRVQQRL